MEKEIKGYEGIYTININGTVKRIAQTNNQFKPGHILKHSTNHKGYKYVQLHKNAKANNHFVHRLIAVAFIPNPENKPFINHINGKTDDNRIENLEWCTASENEKHSYDVLGKTAKRRLSETDAHNIRIQYFNGASLSLLSQEYGVSIELLWGIVTGKTYKKALGPTGKKGYAGENNGQAKLRDAQWPEIYHLRMQGKKYEEIGAIYGVSYQTISRVCKKQKIHALRMKERGVNLK